MYYKEFLRARGAVVAFTIVAAILLVISFLGMLIPHAYQATHEAYPWPGLLAVAALAASIVATCLGSTLSQEGGHLELACTKPYSRAKYAATVIAIDMAAIVATMFIGLAFILIHLIFAHPTDRIVAGPDAAANALRFTLFPLAWYAIIAGVSAGLRGKAGIVQGLIWPVALGLIALRESPFSTAWHNLFVALNVINPLIYISYEDHSMKVIGASPLQAAANVLMLALLLAVGWLAATMQWRRVEA